MATADFSPYDATGPRVGIRRPAAADCSQFTALTKASVDFHKPWVEPPVTREGFYTYLRAKQPPTDDAFLICDRETARIAGVINVSVIVRGVFQSAFLGYWIGAPFANRGYMREGLSLVIQYAFTEMKLHRLEANIQPQNLPSIAVVRRLGFEKEGFSPKYLKVCGDWRDHERWAIRSDFESVGG